MSPPHLHRLPLGELSYFGPKIQGFCQKQIVQKVDLPSIVPSLICKDPLAILYYNEVGFRVRLPIRDLVDLTYLALRWRIDGY